MKFKVLYNEHEYCDLSDSPSHRTKHVTAVDIDAAELELYAWKDSTEYYRNRNGRKRYIGMIHFNTLAAAKGTQ